MDTENITIFEKDIILAQRLCASIEEKDKRNRAVANVLGAKLVQSFFDSSVYLVDTETGLHNVPFILENYEISDIYINNSYVDVRVYFDDDEICVPKSHFDAGILPVAYMFVRLSSDLRSAVVEGFIHPERVDKTKVFGDMYYLSHDDLENLYDVEPRFHNQLDIANISDENLLEFIDGAMPSDKVVLFLADLVKSKSARLKLIKYVKAQSVFNFVSVPQAVQSESEAEPIVREVSQNIEQADEELQAISEEDTDITEDDLDSLFSTSEDYENDNDDTEYSTSITPSGAEVIESLDEEENNMVEGENSEQIDTLFTGEQEGVPVAKQKKRSGIFLVLVLFLALAAGGYLLYTNMTMKAADNDIGEFTESTPEVQPQEVQEPQQAEEAMPVETVENKTSVAAEEENSSTAIPAIEKSLDASVLVSNLKIDWEVPEGYASNTAAKRYLVKLGKVIQLNLKTELLLLQKPPLSNRIAVELKYNPNAGKFETIGIRDSSGEKSVDDIILKTVDGVLKMSVSPNMDSISRLQGSPVLIIRL